jgi:hypothetical protein
VLAHGMGLKFGQVLAGHSFSLCSFFVPTFLLDRAIFRSKVCVCVCGGGGGVGVFIPPLGILSGYRVACSGFMRVGTPQEDQQSQLTWTSGSSQRLSHQSRTYVDWIKVLGTYGQLSLNMGPLTTKADL